MSGNEKYLRTQAQDSTIIEVPRRHSSGHDLMEADPTPRIGGGA